MSRKEGINEVKKHLESVGYTIIEGGNNSKRCIEIQAEKDGILWQFSVMVLLPNKDGVYFGATNSTEWLKGVNIQDDTHKFLFVIVRADITSGPEKIVFIKPEDILRYTTIPSIKFNFNINSSTLSSHNYINSKQKYSISKIIQKINNFLK